MANKVLLAGCGNMGFAMLKSWIEGKVLLPSDVNVVEPNADLRARAAGLGIQAVENVSRLERDYCPNLVIIAVKPQIMSAVLADYRGYARQGAAFLSVAAGISMATYEAALGREVAIVRCMPNTPASIGKGMLVYYNNRNVSDALEQFVCQLLGCNGLVAKIDDEGQMDAVTAVSGSGPGYVFHFIECLTDAAIKAGLPSDIAKMLAIQTVMGAGALAAQSDESPAKLRESVTSPNGTTQAGLNVLMGHGALQKLVNDAVEAARKRSVELGA